MKAILSLAVALILPILFGGSAFGHGIGGENLPVILNDRNATLSISIQPPVFDPTSNESYLSVKLTDTKDAVIEHVTYLVEMSHDGKQIFSEKFHDDLGNLNIRIVSKESESVKIDGDKEPTTGGWTRKLLSPLTMEGPIFMDGGLYKFHVELITVDSDNNVFANKPKLDGAISVAEKTTHSVSGTDGKSYPLSITSYYDRISNFDFDSQNRTVSYDMPFDWNEQNIKQTFVIHEEVHIPKTFAEMLVTKYDGFVNGIPLADTAMTIDDYSEDARVVHLVLNQKDLSSMLGSVSDKTKIHFVIMPSKSEKFPLKAYTHNASFEVGLSWDPVPIQTDTSTRFYVDLSRYYAPKTQENVSYDFVVKQNDMELFRKSMTGTTNAPPKTNYVDVQFSKQNTGTAIISIENIEGNSLSGADYVVVVKPQSEQKPTFPIRLSSLVNENGATSSGKFNVDLTWIPSTLEIGDAEFIITIYDKESGLPVPQATYDFVLLKGDSEIYRKSGAAQAGGSFEDIKLSEQYRGDLVLRIENIANTQEYVKIPISVTPEFPIGTMAVFFAAFGVILVMSKSRIKLNA